MNNKTITLMKSEAKNILAAVGVFASCRRRTNLNLNLCIWPWSKSAKMSAFLSADFSTRNTDSFYRYDGSLTTGGYNEAVIWTLFKETGNLGFKSFGISKIPIRPFQTILGRFRPLTSKTSWKQAP